jgi:hypothetical protein
MCKIDARETKGHTLRKKEIFPQEDRLVENRNACEKIKAINSSSLCNIHGSRYAADVKMISSLSHI